MRQVIFIFLLAIMIGCTSNEKQQESKIVHGSVDCGTGYIPVSFAALLDSGSLYEGKFVEVEGYYSWGFEESAIAYNSSSRNKREMIWVGFTEEVAKSLEKNTTGKNVFDEMTGKKIKARGIVKSKERGHLGQYAVSVNYICFLEVL